MEQEDTLIDATAEALELPMTEHMDESVEELLPVSHEKPTVEETEEMIPTEIFLAPAAEDTGEMLQDSMAVEPHGVEPQAPQQNMAQQAQAQTQGKSPVKPQRVPDPSLSFEAASAKLREIIGRLERGNTSLEESLSLYQEGKYLLGYCQGQISNVKEQVLILKPQGAGGPPLEETFTREKRQ